MFFSVKKYIKQMSMQSNNATIQHRILPQHSFGRLADSETAVSDCLQLHVHNIYNVLQQTTYYSPQETDDCGRVRRLSKKTSLHLITL